MPSAKHPRVHSAGSVGDDAIAPGLLGSAISSGCWITSIARGVVHNRLDLVLAVDRGIAGVVPVSARHTVNQNVASGDQEGDVPPVSSSIRAIGYQRDRPAGARNPVDPHAILLLGGEGGSSVDEWIRAGRNS